MKSEALSWPLTLTLLVLAFGTLVAAGLPLLLTMAGLLGAGGLLFVVRAAVRRVHLGDELRDDVRDRARDRLRAVHRGPLPRRARAGPVAARRHGGHDGHGRQGRARQRAHRHRRAAGGDAGAGPDVPLRAARDRAGRAVGARGDPDAAARRAVRARSPHQRRADTAAHAADGHSERFAAWGRRLWARPLPYAAVAVAILLLLAAPALGLRTGMPTIAVVPHDADSREGHALVERAFGAGAPSGLQVVLDERDLARATAVLERDPGIAAVTPPQRAGGPRAPHRRPDGRRGQPRAALDDRRRARRAPGRRAGGWPGRREPRPRAGARLAAPAGGRRDHGPRIPAPGRAAAGAARRGGRRGAQPVRDRGGVRHRPARVPERSARGGAGLRVAGIRGRLGADLLLRARVRAGDGLHGLPAGDDQGGLRAHAATPARPSSRVWPGRAA